MGIDTPLLGNILPWSQCEEETVQIVLVTQGVNPVTTSTH